MLELEVTWPEPGMACPVTRVHKKREHFIARSCFNFVLATGAINGRGTAHAQGCPLGTRAGGLLTLVMLRGSLARRRFSLQFPDLAMISVTSLYDVQSSTPEGNNRVTETETCM